MTFFAIAPGAGLPGLETPAALVDLDRLERNIARMASYARTHSLALRPHIKTHKATTIAASQLAHGATGLTCATPAEAGVMSAVCDDILLAYPAVGPKLARLMALPRALSLTVALDSAKAVDDLARAARAADRPVRVFVELDVGMHRVGVSAWDEAIALARRVRDSAPLEYAGIAFYPGHIRTDLDSQDAALAALGAAIKSATDALGRAGLAPKVVSGGSTPTVWRTHEIGGITEPERGQSRTEHHRVQVGFAQREAAVAPEIGHPVGDGIVGDRAAVQLGSEIFEPAAHHLPGQLVHPAEVGIDDHRRRAQLAGQAPRRHGALGDQQPSGGGDDPFAKMRVGGAGRHARQRISP